MTSYTALNGNISISQELGKTLNETAVAYLRNCQVFNYEGWGKQRKN
jgi:hypothetical protein